MNAQPASVTAPRVIVISGQSGVGKTTVALRLQSDPRFQRALTATTRAPRGEERDGIDYEFVERGTFLERVERGELLEHAEVYGSLYGTPRQNVQAVLDAGRHCLLVVDVQGVQSLRRQDFEALYVFLEAPDQAEWTRRLKDRGLDSEQALAERVRSGREELEAKSLFDLPVVNAVVEDAAREIAAQVGIDLATANA